MKIEFFSHPDSNSYSTLSLIWDIFSLQFIKNVTTNCCTEIQEQSLKTNLSSKENVPHYQIWRHNLF